MAVSKTTKPRKKASSKQPTSLAESTFERLRRAILTGELKEGDRLKESRLAAEWKIGITPLREAVRRMAAVGYLVLEPNRAPLIRKLTAEDIRRIYELREILECYALRTNWDEVMRSDWSQFEKLTTKITSTSAAPSRLEAQFELDTALHQLWISPPGNPWLKSSLDRLIIYRPNLLAVLVNHQRFANEAFEQHQQIILALIDADQEKAVQLLGQHIQSSGRVLASLTTD